MARAVVRVQTRGVAQTNRALSRLERQVQTELLKTMETLEVAALEIFKEWAPGSGGYEGNMARGLRASRISRIDRPGFSISSTYRDPETGFDPLPVTRFGHRRKFIRPRRDRGAATVVATRARRGPNKSTMPALRLTDFLGNPIFRYQVRGHHPPYDWVERAREEVDLLIEGEAQRLGRRITSTLRV